MKRYLCIFTLAIVCSLTAAAARGADDMKKEGEKSDKPTQEQLIKDLEKTLTGAKLVGQFTVTGGAERPPAKEEYTITSAQKIPDGDLWLLKANIKYGKTDQTFPIPLEIKWAGDTPVITLTKMSIPGLGTFSSRVVLYEGRYAGTWQHDKIGGHLFGTIEKAEEPKKEESKKDDKKQ
jgi:hypothetical protein